MQIKQNKQMCKVTIAIACYNVEKYIEETFLSVLNQDFEDYEILVCDDCSTDKTIQIIKEIASNHSNGHLVRIISNPVNSGTAAVRNNCIDNAKGEYLFFIDGDDYISQNCISLLYAKMQEYPYDIVMANHQAFYDSGEKMDLAINKNINYMEYSSHGEMAILKWMERFQTDIFPGSIWNKLYRVTFLRTNNIRCILNHSIIEDIYFSFLTILKTQSFASINEVTLSWRQRRGSAMNREFTEKQFRLYLQVLDDMCHDIQMMKTNNQKKEIQKEIYYYIGKRYLTDFVMRNLLKNKLVNRKCKEEYFDHISKLIDIGYKREYAKSRLERIVLKNLKNKNRYWIFKISFLLDDFIRLSKKNILSFTPDCIMKYYIKTRDALFS